MRTIILGLIAAAMAGTASADDIQYYTYDVHGRLVRVQHAGTINTGRDTEYAYDDADNRTERDRTEPPAALAQNSSGDGNEADRHDSSAAARTDVDSDGGSGGGAESTAPAS